MLNVATLGQLDHYMDALAFPARFRASLPSILDDRLASVRVLDRRINVDHTAILAVIDRLVPVLVTPLFHRQIAATLILLSESAFIEAGNGVRMLFRGVFPDDLWRLHEVSASLHHS